MAVTIQNDSIGPYVQFVGPDKRRRKFRLGNFTEKQAAAFVEGLNRLLTTVRRKRRLDNDLYDWSMKLDAEDHAKLVTYGLLSPRDDAPAVGGAKGGTAEPVSLDLLGPFVKNYIDLRRNDEAEAEADDRTAKPSASRKPKQQAAKQPANVERAGKKPRTIVTYEQTEGLLLRYFGAERRLDSVTPGDADEFKLWALRSGGRTERPGDRDGRKLGANTVNRRCRIASQFFRQAKRKKLIAENPFEGVGGAVVANDDRMKIIDPETAKAVLDACPDAEWRLIFALARFGGLRVPSELAVLRWTDVDWAESRIAVDSPKTGRRIVPIFRELRPYLEAVFDLPTADPVFVVPRAQNENLRTNMLRIIKRAKLPQWPEGWPKVFQNLRFSRQTELAQVYPIHVVCQWLGNSPDVAMEHYLRATEADFTRATGADPARVQIGEGAGAKSGASIRVRDGQAWSGGSADFAFEHCRTRLNTPDHETDSDEGRPCRTRTYDQGIMSPLL